MAAIRRAKASWEGNLFAGKGTVTAESSGLFRDAAITWAARTEASDGRTSPEELIAAAHAGCFCMALANGLDKAGTPPSRLDVSVAVTFDKTEAGMRVTRSEIAVSGKVPGLDQATFESRADAARDGCPVSNALKGNVAISVSARLVA